MYTDEANELNSLEVCLRVAPVGIPSYADLLVACQPEYGITTSSKVTVPLIKKSNQLIDINRHLFMAIQLVGMRRGQRNKASETPNLHKESSLRGFPSPFPN